MHETFSSCSFICCRNFDIPIVCVSFLTVYDLHNIYSERRRERVSSSFAEFSMQRNILMKKVFARTKCENLLSHSAKAYFLQSVTSYYRLLRAATLKNQRPL